MRRTTAAGEGRTAPSNSEMITSFSGTSGREAIKSSKLELETVIFAKLFAKRGRSQSGIVTTYTGRHRRNSDGSGVTARLDAAQRTAPVTNPQAKEYYLSYISTVPTGMKRQREGPSNTPSPSDNTNIITRPPPKRAKASQACSSCRKHKTRCELLESWSNPSRCHRCDVLSITCSFEANAPPNPVPVVDNSPEAAAQQRLLRTILSVPEPNPDRCLEQAQAEMNESTPRPTVMPAWEFLKIPGMPDWTATPMLAMLTLSKMAFKNQPTIQPAANITFIEVLTGDQIQHLLDV